MSSSTILNLNANGDEFRTTRAPWLTTLQSTMRPRRRSRCGCIMRAAAILLITLLGATSDDRARTNDALVPAPDRSLATATASSDMCVNVAARGRHARRRRLTQ
jgi:hypothetical protein